MKDIGRPYTDLYKNIWKNKIIESNTCEGLKAEATYLKFDLVQLSGFRLLNAGLKLQVIRTISIIFGVCVYSIQIKQNRFSI